MNATHARTSNARGRAAVRARAARQTRRVGVSARMRPAGATGIVPLLMVLALAVALLGPGARADAHSVDRFETLTVAEGASLWAIAEAHPVPGLGTAATVDVIRSANGLQTSVVHVGQTLRVPAPASTDPVVAAR